LSHGVAQNHYGQFGSIPRGLGEGKWRNRNPRSKGKLPVHLDGTLVQKSGHAYRHTPTELGDWTADSIPVRKCAGVHRGAMSELQTRGVQESTKGQEQREEAC
jgi:hypothetical protein